MSDVNEFLGDLRSDGTVESEGVFTMAVEEAAWKLAQYRLTEPERYPIHLVACAVANGARRLHISTGRGKTTYLFDGEPFTQEDLSLLRLPVLGSDTPSRLRELAIALNAVGGLATSYFTTSSSGGTGMALDLRGQDVTLEVTQEAEKGQKLVVEHELSKDALLRMREHCRFAPLDLRVNNSVIRGPIDFGVTATDFYAFFHLQGDRELVVRSAALRRDKIFRLEKKEPGRATLTLSLTSPDRAQRAGFLLLKDGVATRIDNGFLDCAMLCGAVAADGLKKDISETGYVEDEAFQALMSYVRTEALGFLEAFCRTDSRLPPASLAAFRSDLEDLLESGYQSGTLEDFLHTSMLAGGSGEEEQFRVAAENAKAGRMEEYRELQAGLRAEAAQARKKLRGLNLLKKCLKRESRLHNAVGKTDPELLELEAVVKALAGEPEALVWANTTRLKRQHLTSESVDASLFRAHLISLAAAPATELRKHLDEMEPIPGWTTFLGYHHAMTRGRIELQESGETGWERPLHAFRLAHMGRLEESLSLFEELATQTSHGVRWLEVAYAITRGRQSFPQWVRLRARLSGAMHRTDDSWRRVWHEYRDWRGLISAKEISGIPVQHWPFALFSQSFFPLFLLYYHLHWQQSSPLYSRRASLHQLIAKILLQQSLGGVDDSLCRLEALPDTGRFWDL